MSDKIETTVEQFLFKVESQGLDYAATNYPPTPGQDEYLDQLILCFASAHWLLECHVEELMGGDGDE